MATTNPAINKDDQRQLGMEDRNRNKDLGGMADKAKDTASQVVDRAKDIASSAAHRAQDLAAGAEKRAEQATASVGSGMQSLAGTMRERGPHEGVLGTATSRIANTLDSGGRYLQEEGLGGMAEDLTNVIRRNPIPALFIGIGLGFLLARATRR